MISVFITIILGTIGGAVFEFLQLPLAWMIGAMSFTTLASVCGAPLKSSKHLRNLVLPILGVMLGSAFNPEVIGKVELWIPSLITMIVYIILVITSISFLFYKFVKVDFVTAFFCATPGGLATMTIIGAEKGGNEQTIALTHSVRIFLTVLIIPFWFQIFQNYEPTNDSNLVGFESFSLGGSVSLIACGLIGYFVGKLIRLPSFQLLGPMLLSATIHILDFTDAKPPIEVVNIAQIIIGAGIGARFAGISVLHVSRVLISATCSTIYILGLAAIVSYLLEQLTGLPFHALWTAFAPGGLAEMALISLSMGIDPAFVSTHHLLRVSFILVMALPGFQFYEKILNLNVVETKRDP